jgi:GNAT superfamily N-acetyltransferase
MHEGSASPGVLDAALLARLLASPADYRHALAMLDPEYHEWRPEGKPAHCLAIVGGVSVLTVESDGVAYVLGDISDASALAAAAFVSDHNLNELKVSGEASFAILRNCLTNGQWRLSRNYEATGDRFRFRPNSDVRLLKPEDKGLLEAACRASPAIGGSRSTMRDFAYMIDGLPVVCYGAFADGQLVGFCSANPICRGVTEISWVVVAETHRRRGFASGLLTPPAQEAFARGDRVAYLAGSAETDLDAMLAGLGFREIKGCFRFIPAAAHDQWRTTWGRPV